jgi:hypothetical protein
LLTTLALFYFGWLLFTVPATIVLIVFKGVVGVLLTVIGRFENVGGARAAVGSINVLAWALIFGLPLAFWVLTHRLLVSAASWMAVRKRFFKIYFILKPTYQGTRGMKRDEAIQMGVRRASFLAQSASPFFLPFCFSSSPPTRQLYYFFVILRKSCPKRVRFGDC